MIVSYTSTLAQMSVLKKLQLSYAIEKEGWILAFFPHAKKSVHFKILQLVHARNRLIQQLFVPFLVASNSHQYESKEWPPVL